jgi:GH35 family endo-1,4-beta-xylanase
MTFDKLCAVADSAAGGDPAKLPQGTALLSAGGVSDFRSQGAQAKATAISVTGQPFTTALRAQTLALPKNAWEAQLAAPTAAAVKKGDRLLASFALRCEKSLNETGECQSEFVFEKAGAPYTKSVSFPVRAGKDWTRIYVPFEAAEDYAKGGASLLLRMGYPPQTFDLADVRVTNYGTSVTLDDLPRTRVAYEGSAANAPWRAAAAKRIDDLRKAPLTVRVVDGQGRPVAGARLNVKLRRHAFPFGTAISSDYLRKSPEPPDLAQYKKVASSLFGMVVEENYLKWPALAGDWGPNANLEVALAGLDWARSAGLRTKGHTLVWPSWRNSPKSLKSLEGQPEALRAAVREHVLSTAKAVRGHVEMWDVVNEPFDNHDLTDILGEAEMVKWFELARQGDPESRLLINDYAILSGGGGETGHRAHYERVIKLLVDGKAPLEGIGMQGHFGLALTGMNDALAILDRYGKFGLPIYITEYDIAIDDLRLAGDYTRDLLTLLFSHPRVAGFMTWGFWDGSHWKSNAPFFGQDWCIKPAGVEFVNLVHKTWSTRASGVTSAAGTFTTRAFLGEYELTATVGGKTKTVTASVAKPAGSVEIVVQ